MKLKKYLINKVSKEIQTRTAKEIRSEKGSKATAVGLWSSLEEKAPINKVSKEIQTTLVTLINKVSKEVQTCLLTQTISGKLSIAKSSSALWTSIEGTTIRRIRKSIVNKVSKNVQTKTDKGSKSGIGLWIPLEGKKPDQQEKLLRGLVQHGISIPEGNTESVKNLIRKVKKDLGLPPSPITTADKDKYVTARATGLITPLHRKTAMQKERILRALATRSIPLPEGRTASEKSLITKIAKEFKPVSSSDELDKNRALALTLLERKSPKPKYMINEVSNVKRRFFLPEKKTHIALLNETKKEVSFPGLTVDKEKKKYTNSQFRDIHPSKSIARNEKILKRLREINKVLPDNSLKVETALIDIVKNRVQSSITSSLVSTETFCQQKANSKKANNNSGRLLSKPVESTSQRAKNHNPGTNKPISLLGGMSTPQKEIILKALSENGELPGLELTSETADVHRSRDVELDHADLTIRDELTIKTTVEKGNNSFLTSSNNTRVPGRKLILGSGKNVRKRTAVKAKADILKEKRIEKSVVSDLPEGKKKTLNNKQKNKVSAGIKKSKAQDAALGGIPESIDTLEMKPNDVVTPRSPLARNPTIAYTGWFNAAKPNIGAELKKIGQDSILTLVLTYLANTELDV